MTDDGKTCGNREALSIDPEKDDLYAMGGTPIMALPILCMPVDKILAKMARRVLQGRTLVDAFRLVTWRG
jgi:selenophosphate synthase